MDPPPVTPQSSSTQKGGKLEASPSALVGTAPSLHEEQKQDIMAPNSTTSSIT